MISFLKKLLYKILNYPEQINENVLISGFSRGIQNVKFEGKNKIADRCNFSGKVKIGYATTLGYNNILFGDVMLGKYCQIGFDVAFHSTNHPSKYMTTYINKNLFNGELATLKEHNSIIVGNDVWIGHNAIILGDVTIGNGAIVAAGSVVTKDVPAYSVVAGIPAKEIKKRFSGNVIKELQELAWWNKNEEELEKIKPLFFRDLTNVNSIYEGNL